MRKKIDLWERMKASSEGEGDQEKKGGEENQEGSRRGLRRCFQNIAGMGSEQLEQKKSEGRRKEWYKVEERRNKERNKEIRICFWNVAGIESKCSET